MFSLSTPLHAKAPPPHGCVLQSSLNPPAAIAAVRKNPERPINFSAPLALTLILGGTSARWTLTDGLSCRPESQSLKWDEMDLPANAPAHELTDTALTNLIIKSLVPFLQQHSVDPRQVDAVGFSIAGIINGEGPGALINLQNVPFIRNYPACERFLEIWKELTGDLKLALIGSRNDAKAALEGERLSPEGALNGETSGILCIIGTGVGSTGCTAGELDPSYDEGGHIVLCDPKGRFVRQSIEQLKAAGAFDNGVFGDAPRGYQYAEHMLAGPWAAVHLVKQFARQGLLEPLAREIGGESGTQQLCQQLSHMAVLREEEIGAWSKQVRSSLVRQVLTWLFAVTSETTALAREGGDSAKGLISEAGFEFKKLLLQRTGEFISVLTGGSPSHKVVLVGGVAEALRDAKDADFCYRCIQGFSGLPPEKLALSVLSAEKRESAFVAEAIELGSKPKP